MRASIQVQVYSGDPSWAPVTALLPPHGWPRKLSGHLFIHSTNPRVSVAKRAPLNGAKRPLRKWDLCTSQPTWKLTFWPLIVFTKTSRASAQCSKILITYPKITPDSLSLKDNTSFLVSEDSFVAFVFMSPWLSLPQNTLVDHNLCLQTAGLKSPNEVLCSLRSWYWLLSDNPDVTGCQKKKKWNFFNCLLFDWGRRLRSKG